MRLVLGTRGSALALWQAEFVQRILEHNDIPVELEIISTTGDQIQDVALSKIGDKALFTKELDQALLDKRIHLAVHSMKDLPTSLPEGVTIAAITEREEPWDAFIPATGISGKLSDLPEGARIATSSLRRMAQLKAWRQDLEIVSIRGNVDTRLRKLDAGDWHGIVLAAAGLVRLGLEERIGERIPADIMVPAVGQGALGIVCSEDEASVSSMLHRLLHDAHTGLAVLSERAFMRRLEGGCQVPVGALGHVMPASNRLVLEGCVAAPDGAPAYRASLSGEVGAPEQLGVHLAEYLLHQGADEILNQIRHAG